MHSEDARKRSLSPELEEATISAAVHLKRDKLRSMQVLARLLDEHLAEKASQAAHEQSK